MINAQKSNEEATTVVQNGVKDSGYNTNNTVTLDASSSSR